MKKKFLYGAPIVMVVAIVGFASFSGVEVFASRDETVQPINRSVKTTHTELASHSRATDLSNERVQRLFDFSAQSPSKRPYFIELFTSQGCSSCPPAEAWLSEFKQEPKLWQQYFPIAFHVTYWDYIGWKDPYGQRKFSQRQYDHLNQLNVKQVYTPQFVVNGQEWRGWFNRVFGTTFSQAPQDSGVLTVQLDDLVFAAHFEPTLPNVKGRASFHMALVSAGLSTYVRSGENHDKQLQHDFTVRYHQSYDVSLNQGAFDLKTQLSLDIKDQLQRIHAEQGGQEKLAWLIWFELDRKPLQAVASWLDKAELAAINHAPVLAIVE
ncbi:DUF1223 domain-containing protein [Shewanella gelidii]|nr:DUF1223 domain-containing protein [Shewanella gelidii]MCL1097569.1 DUF1223 domain-containing protein [Shewanella gelidii]